MRRLLASIFLLLVLGAVPQAAQAMLLGTQSDSAVYRTGVDDRGAARYSKLLDSSGATAHRVALRWGRIARGCGTHSILERSDPALACYDWQHVDQALGYGAPNAGRTNYVSVREPPCWLHGDPACSDDASGAGFVGSTPGQLVRFRNELTAFLTAAARRYAPAGSEPLAGNWTIWTEPNAPYFWSEEPRSAVGLPDAQDRRQPPVAARACHFAHVYAHVVRTLRGEGSIAPLRFGIGPFAPGAGKQPLAYLESMLGASPGAGAFGCALGGTPLVTETMVDGVAVHPYPVRGLEPWADCPDGPAAPLPERSMSLQCIEQLRATLDDPARDRFQAVRGAPFWALELAYEDSADDPARGVQALVQALWLPAALHRLWLSGTEVASWYPAVDGGEVADWQSGLVKANVTTLRPSYLTFQAPLSLRRLADGRWEAWALERAGEQVRLLVSERCDGQLRALEPERQDGALVARFVAPVAAGRWCLSIEVDGEVARSVRYGVDQDADPPAPFVEVARVVHDRLRNPRGDTVSSLDPEPTGNPTLQALLRVLVLGSDEPVRIDPAQQPLLHLEVP